MRERKLPLFPARLWACADTSVGPLDCWLWRRPLDPLGYGRIRYHGKSAYAHRVAYELVVGPIPVGLTIDHLCRTRSCIRPDHLDLVTQRENVLRGDGPAGKNSRKTHCKNGHPFDAENTRMYRGYRICQPCAVASVAVWQAKNSGKVREYQKRSRAKRRQAAVEK